MPNTEQETGNGRTREGRKKTFQGDPWSGKKKIWYVKVDQKRRFFKTGGENYRQDTQEKSEDLWSSLENKRV